MVERCSDTVYRSSLLLGQAWLDHGFGSRKTDGWPEGYTRVRQIHSAIVMAVPPNGGDQPSEADGIVCTESGRWVGIRTADCVAILIADPVTRSVGALHAGWRGTIANIAGAGVSRLTEMYGTQPENLIAAIGPSIGRCCFEVGPEVAQEFKGQFPEAPDELDHIDLPEANRRQLIAAGIPAASVDLALQCTKCFPEEFHSWRRDREQAGRMVSAIRILA